jgi:hypothetical protein
MAHKAIFIPFDQRIIDKVRGFVLNGEFVPGLTEADIYRFRSEYSVEHNARGWGRALRIFWVILIVIPLIPVLVLIGLITQASSIQYADKVLFPLESLLALLSGGRIKKKVYPERRII